MENETNQNDMRKCKRCKRYLVGEQWHTKCYFHPGNFVNSTGWSCCNKEVTPNMSFKYLKETSAPIPSLSDELPTPKEIIQEAAIKFMKELSLHMNKQLLIKNSAEIPLLSTTVENSEETSSEITTTTNKNNSIQLPFINIESTWKSRTQKQREEQERLLEHFRQLRYKRPENKTLSPQERLDYRDDPDLSPFSPISIGCTITENHIEDEQFSTILKNFPLAEEKAETTKNKLPEEILKEKLTKVDKKEEEKSSVEETASTDFIIPLVPFAEQSEGSDIISLSIPSQKEEEEEAIPEFFVHEVQIGDTLIGLSLKYNVPVDELQRVNFLSNANRLQISHLKNIKIPTHGRRFAPQKKKTLQKHEILQNFITRCKCSSDEAKYFLGETDWNLEEAIKEFNADKEWAEKNKDKFHSPNQVIQPTPQPKEGVLSRLAKAF